ncbi:hypothetical protein BHE74_00010942 [Ensete ventricosum]|nr:hypothetical protein BHE74_00010942 [Ensete ventricosum]RZS09059.1 hypothetical protein BHM03_00040097 [Ensete ventricosum]
MQAAATVAPSSSPPHRLPPTASSPFSPAASHFLLCRSLLCHCRPFFLSSPPLAACCLLPFLPCRSQLAIPLLSLPSASSYALLFPNHLCSFPPLQRPSVACRCLASFLPTMLLPSARSHRRSPRCCHTATATSCCHPCINRNRTLLPPLSLLPPPPSTACSPTQQHPPLPQRCRAQQRCRYCLLLPMLATLSWLSMSPPAAPQSLTATVPFPVML